LVFCFLFPIITLAQKDLKPGFTNFEGKVYKLPLDSLRWGYRPYVEALEPVDYLTWKKIMVRVRAIKDPFPDIEMKKEFGIIFTTQMMIPQDGNYEFILASDDGSKLWIEEELIVDNDGVHHMAVARDSINLKRGLYPIKIWYYQAYPSKYGFIFDSRYLGPEMTEVREPIVWDGDILFDFDNYNLSHQGLIKLDSLVHLLSQNDIEEVTIMGHTDNVGPVDYNYRLSERRAQSIKQYIESTMSQIGIKLVAIGYGEQQPRAPNDTAHNRAKNRRVELVLSQ